MHQLSTLQGRENLDWLNLAIEELGSKISENCMSFSGRNSKHIQGKCAESMLTVDAGGSLLRSTVRGTREKGTSIACWKLMDDDGSRMGWGIENYITEFQEIWYRKVLSGGKRERDTDTPTKTQTHT